MRGLAHIQWQRVTGNTKSKSNSLKKTTHPGLPPLHPPPVYKNVTCGIAFVDGGKYKRKTFRKRSARVV